MFINLSNHPSEMWSEKQKTEAKKYGEICDIAFPGVRPEAKGEEINQLVESYIQKIMKYNQPIVMVQGEFVFTYRLVNKLKERGIKVVSACSERVVSESYEKDGTSRKESIFQFVQFREY